LILQHRRGGSNAFIAAQQCVRETPNQIAQSNSSKAHWSSAAELKNQLGALDWLHDATSKARSTLGREKPELKQHYSLRRRVVKHWATEADSHRKADAEKPYPEITQNSGFGRSNPSLQYLTGNGCSRDAPSTLELYTRRHHTAVHSLVHRLSVSRTTCG
jgi:hypothetical protein